MNEDDKLGEARHFLSRMQSEKENPVIFKYNLSACLSSARSVTQYAVDEAKYKDGGQEWYDEWMSSEILRFFKEKRNYNIHKAPIPLRKHINLRITETIRVTESIHIVVKDKDGKILETRDIIEPTEQTIKGATPALSESRYEFDDWPGKDVISLCERYLIELENFIQDGKAKGFLSS